MEANNIIVLAVIVVMLLHLALGLPLFAVLGLGSLALIILCDVYSLSVFGEVPFSAIDSWALLAMPLFILAGEIISRGRTARILLGWRGYRWLDKWSGRQQFLDAFFAGTSGSSSADTITIGRIMIPAMRSRGYNVSMRHL